LLRICLRRLTLPYLFRSGASSNMGPVSHGDTETRSRMRRELARRSWSVRIAHTTVYHRQSPRIAAARFVQVLRAWGLSMRRASGLLLWPAPGPRGRSKWWCLCRAFSPQVKPQASTGACGPGRGSTGPPALDLRCSVPVLGGQGPRAKGRDSAAGIRRGSRCRLPRLGPWISGQSSNAPLDIFRLASALQ
jgi:hypothetical protein